MRTALASLTAAVAVSSLLLAPQAAAEPTATTLEDTVPVAPGLVRELRSWSTPGGPQQLQILRFRLDDPRLDLRPELAGGVVAGREPVHRTVLRAGDDVVAGINAGFWLSTPDGDPEGLVIQDGRYVSEPASQGAGPRAAFALFADDTWAVGRPDHHGEVWFPSGRSAPLFGIDRAAPEGALVALNSAYADRTRAPDDAAEAVFAAELTPNMLGTHRVVEVRPPGGPLEDGQTVLVGRGRWAAELVALEPGDLVTFDLRSSQPWDHAVHALAAGPLLVEDGERVPRDMWETEGFAHKVHNDRAHPRTVVGFTAEGEVLLVTVDGRQRGSAGLTTDEATDLMLGLGAVDAVMMDGGGSTTMSVDGRIVNDPCCDSPGYRWVATSLVVRSSTPTPDVDRLSGTDRYATAAEIARHGWAGGAAHAYLASGAAFPDGLAGGPLAAAGDAPLLLSTPDRLPDATRAALVDLGVRRVTILGGQAAVSDAVAQDLAAAGLQVERIAGSDRYATAAEAARRLPARSEIALLANGRGFPDALAAVVPAHAAQAPLLLTSRATLPDPTRVAIQELGIQRVVIAGGDAAVSDDVARSLTELGVTVERAAGASRYETAVELVRWAEGAVGFAPRQLAVASGANFPDALAGGAYAASAGAAVLLSRHESLERTGEPGAWLAAHELDHAYVLGGRVVLSTWLAHELQQATERG